MPSGSPPAASTASSNSGRSAGAKPSRSRSTRSVAGGRLVAEHRLDGESRGERDAPAALEHRLGVLGLSRTTVLASPLSTASGRTVPRTRTAGSSARSSSTRRGARGAGRAAAPGRDSGVRARLRRAGAPGSWRVSVAPRTGPRRAGLPRAGDRRSCRAGCGRRGGVRDVEREPLAQRREHGLARVVAAAPQARSVPSGWTRPRPRASRIERKFLVDRLPDGLGEGDRWSRATWRSATTASRSGCGGAATT